MITITDKNMEGLTTEFISGHVNTQGQYGGGYLRVHHYLWQINFFQISTQTLKPIEQYCTWPNTAEKHPVLSTMTSCLGHSTAMCLQLPRIVFIREREFKSFSHAKFLYYRLEIVYLLKPLCLMIFKILSCFQSLLWDSSERVRNLFSPY